MTSVRKMAFCKKVVSSLFISAIVSFAVVPSVFAVGLNLVPQFPDFVVTYSGSGEGVSYDHTTSILTITGKVSSYTEVAGGSQNNVATYPLGVDPTPEIFTLTATIDSAKCPGPGCITSGNFTIDGEVVNPSGDFNDPLYDGGNSPDGLLSGDLTDFGWTSTNSQTGVVGHLELTFNNASGVIAEGPLTQGGNAPYAGGGMILALNSSTSLGFNFDTEIFNNSWTLTGNGDVFVPIPAAIWLFGSGLLGVFGLGLRGRKSNI